MIQTGRQPSLLREAFERTRRRLSLPCEELQSDSPACAFLLGFPDFGKSSAPEYPFETITAERALRLKRLIGRELRHQIRT